MGESPALVQMLAPTASHPRLVPLHEIGTGLFVHDGRVFARFEINGISIIFPVLSNGKISSRLANLGLKPSDVVESAEIAGKKIYQLEWEKDK